MAREVTLVSRVALLGLATLLSCRLMAQETFHAAADMVVLPVSVADAAARPVGGLDRTAFHIVEDGAPQTIAFFSRDAQPIALSLLIDTSTSMEAKLATAEAAAIGFAQRLGPHDLAQVISFDSDANIAQPFTSDEAALERAIRQLHTGGSTSLYTAVYVALNELQRVHPDAPGDIRRQAIIVLSDGEDTSSIVGYDDVLDQSKHAPVSIYAIGLRSKSEEKPHGFDEADYFLRSLSQTTGGRAFVVSAVADLAGIYQQIADELAHQYVLGYTSTNTRADGTWRHVVVTVDRPGVSVRTRGGYFGPKGAR